MITFKPLNTKHLEVVLQMMQDFYAIDGYPMDVDRTNKLLNEFILNPVLGSGFLICNSKSNADVEIVGYAILTFVFSFEYGGKIAFVDELFIKESYRGMGFGNETILFLKEKAEKLSLKLLYLEVENHNEKAQKLYLAHDFVFHNRKLMKYKVVK